MDIRTVLFVDDEERILNALARSLMDEPYEIRLANSGSEAIEVLQQHEVHVIVTDLSMPGMNGLELLGIVKKEYPHIARLILSGHSETDVLLDAINQGEILRYITKPWKSDKEFKVIIRQAIEYYDLHSEREMLMAFCEQLIEGKEPGEVNIRLIQALISKRKRHLYDWHEKFSPSLPGQQ